MQLLGRQRVDEAVQACLAFAQANPDSIDAVLLLGKARRMQGRFEDMQKLSECRSGSER
jgi:hypothetical protein